MSAASSVIVIVVAVLVALFLVGYLMTRSARARRVEEEGRQEARARRGQAHEMGLAAQEEQRAAEHARREAAQERERAEEHALRASEAERAAAEREELARETAHRAEEHLRTADALDPDRPGATNGHGDLHSAAGPDHEAEESLGEPGDDRRSSGRDS